MSPHTPWVETTPPLTRRGFFHRVSGGIYGAALTYLLGQGFGHGSKLSASDPSTDLKPRPPHFELATHSVHAHQRPDRLLRSCPRRPA